MMKPSSLPTIWELIKFNQSRVLKGIVIDGISTSADVICASIREKRDVLKDRLEKNLKIR